MEYNELDEVDAIDSRKTDDILNFDIDLVITSPPYADLKDYGHDNQIGHGQSKEEYMDDLMQVFEGVHGSLAEDGSMWVIIDTYKRDGDTKLLPFKFAEKIKEIGFDLKDIIVWDKTRTLPWTRDGEMRNVFEYILVFSKNSSDDLKFRVDRIREADTLKDYWIKYPERYHPKGKVPSNIWDYDIPSQGSWGDDQIQHACPFPPELVSRIISVGSDPEDIVFDPFAGTGTVVAQAEAMERRGLGFELNQEYIDNYETTIKPKIMEAWSQEDTDRDSTKKEHLQDKIHKLRQLKYPKTIVRRLINDKGWSEDELHLNTLFAIPQESAPEGEHKRISEKIIIVHTNGFDEEQLEEDIESVCRQPPLSKFGIDAEIEIIKLEDLEDEVEDHFEENNFHLYTDSNFTDSVKKMTYEDWLEACQRKKWNENFRYGVPPILSPLNAKKSKLKRFL